jgi:hypothetical protein
MAQEGGIRKKSKPVAGATVTPPNNTGEDLMFKFKGELLHGGQGKDNALVNIDCIHDPMGNHAWQPCMTTGWEGLQPPWLKQWGEPFTGITC